MITAKFALSNLNRINDSNQADISLIGAENIIGVPSSITQLQNNLITSQVLLRELAADEDVFLSTLRIAFGGSYDSTVAEKLRQQWLEEDFSDLPVIEILSAAELNGALGAYAKEQDRIYLSLEFVQSATAKQLVAVLLEEIGHGVDSRLNRRDSLGDEGAIFSALVRRVELKEEQLESLHQEDDASVVVVNDELVAIEQAKLVVSLLSSSPNLTNAFFSVAASFSENTSDFDETDLTINNGTVSNFKGSGTFYTFDVTPTSDGNVTVDIADKVATDAAGNNNTAAAQLSRTYDQTPPTVSLRSSSPNPTNASFLVAAIFSENTSDFNVNDLAIANGAVSNFKGSGTFYTFDVTPTADGNVTVDIADNVATDAAGNKNTAATQLSRTYDQTPPTVSLTSASSDPTNAPFTVTATFSENTSDFDVTDLTITNGTVSNFKGSGTDYTFDVTPTADGNVTVDIADNVATDAAGNNNTAAAQLTRTYDPTPPTVTLGSSSPDPTNAPFTVTATFSEDTSDFDDTDLTITNGTVTNFSGSGRDYTFDVTPTADGNVTVDIADNVATDAAGNNNTAAAQLTRTYDPTPPTVTLASSSPDPTNAPFTVTATFSEDTSDFDDTDLTIANGTVTNFSGSGRDY
ncbi:Ig-like domain-containing protein, partial [Pleurocapsa sp. PCC 7319]|uniref:Ig-like domain-containing protein n=1 Tax=Pleurocapsa sp. PCC 7319 TaxID=118161 RepID=UPI00056419FA